MLRVIMLRELLLNHADIYVASINKAFLSMWVTTGLAKQVIEADI